MTASNAVNLLASSRIDHRNWCQALADLHSCMIAAQPGEVVCVAGPSRVGKTRLIGEIENIVVGSDLKKGTKPVASILASNIAYNGNFDTKTFNSEMLDVLEHPVYSTVGLNPEEAAKACSRYDRTPTRTIEKAVKNSLTHREVSYLFIDEAQHVLHAKGGDSVASAIMDSWKCLAQQTGVVLVLVGTYSLLQAIKLSPHMVGRKLQVHFPRYRETAEDIQAFEQILDSYNKILSQNDIENNLREWDEILYYGTLGCVGRLSLWLRMALADMQLSHTDSLSKRLLIKSRIPRDELEELRLEIQFGEKHLLYEEEEKVPDTSSSGQKRKSKKKPFTKNPKRYPYEGRA